MSNLSQLSLRDLRPQLAVISSPSRRRRQGGVTSLTLHYNGPAVGAFGRPEGEIRHIADVDVPNHQQRLGADSLMYHLVVLSDGSIWQTRDLELQAWHCRRFDGNEHSLAIHLPLGGTQDATPAQWQATTRLFDALITDFGLAGRHVVKGHREWSATLCPGPLLMSRLEQWRAAEGAHSFSGGLFRIINDVASANVREGPGISFPVALAGRAIMFPGDMLAADEIVSGEPLGFEHRWAHRGDGLGYVHMSLLEPLA